MAINPAALALAFVPPKPDAASALAAFKAAWEASFVGAMVATAGIPPGGLSVPLAAMDAGLLALYVPTGTAASAAAALTASASAFWTALLPLIPTVFTLPPPAPLVLVPGGTPPPGLAGMTAALTSVFQSNVLLKDPISAAAAITGALTAGLVGGFALGSILPAPPAPIPIL
jgi:hypothetical protein